MKKINFIKSLRLFNIKSPLPNLKTFFIKVVNLGPSFFQIIITLIIILFVYIIYNYNLLSNLQNIFSDQFLYSNNIPDKDIIILAIDDKSLQQYGRWPWDRDVLAKIQNKLNGFNLKTVAWNMTFFEPTDKDDVLAESFNSKIPIILSSQINPKWQSGYVEPIETLKKENVDIGFVNIRADSDGKIRNTPLYEFDRNRICHKSFALVIYEKYTGRIYNNPCEYGLPDIPLENKNELIINYAGAPDTFQTISVADFLEYDTIPGVLENKIIIIGVTARYIQDYKLSPTSSAFMSGTEILGNIFYTIKNQRFIQREDSSQIILGIILIAIICFIILRFQNPLVGSILILGILNVYVLYVIWQFSNGIIMDIVYLPFTAIISWIIQIIITFYINKKSEEYVKGAFEHYVSKRVLNEIIKDKDKLSLGGESKKLTVLFSDIRKFTTYAEKISAKKLVIITNEYLNRMSKVILDNDGYIDKYIGDEIMAFWGAPIDNPKHAYLACITALNMRKELAQWKKEKRFDEKTFKTGIGINTGNMIVGNIGSDTKFSYTVLGDKVNLGSRLEGLTKIYKVPIIISGDTYNELEKQKFVYNPINPIKGSLIFRKLDVVKVKNREKLVALYELVSTYEDIGERLSKIETFEKGLYFYQKGDFNKALSIFNTLLNNDPAVKIFIKRINSLGRRKPKDWNGTWKIERK